MEFLLQTSYTFKEKRNPPLQAFRIKGSWSWVSVLTNYPLKCLRIILIKEKNCVQSDLRWGLNTYTTVTNCDTADNFGPRGLIFSTRPFAEDALVMGS